MPDDLRELWNQVINRAKQQFNNPNFSMLIEGARPVSLSANTLTVMFPDAWARDWVEARHLGEITQVVRSYLPTVHELRLVSPEDRGRNDKAPHAGQPVQNGTHNGGMLSSARRHEPVVRNGHDGRDRIMGAPLNPRYTFDTFVVGPSNHFAQAASLAVAEDPAGVYNPLFLYGGVGLGKTHLMQAIAHYVRENHQELYVVYVSSETFTNDLINALSKRAMAEFRKKYRQVDLLLIDDIQFVAGKEQTQEEFFHTFNALYEANKQIVISSDRPPKDIPTLEERLRSRFEWGLTTDIQVPDLETRIAILRKKGEIEGISLPNETLLYIATEIQSNIRELEGALIRVVAYASLQGRPVTPEVAEEALKDIVSSKRMRVITVEAIQQAVANHYGISVEDMKGKKRTRSVTFPRQVAMFLCRELTDASLPAIGEEFGGRDHSTVMHACEKIKAEAEMNGPLSQTLKEIAQRIKGGAI